MGSTSRKPRTIKERLKALPTLTLLMEVRVQPLANENMARWRTLVLEPACGVFCAFIEAQSRITMDVWADAQAKVTGSLHPRERPEP
jgi:hypothetical protein